MSKDINDITNRRSLKEILPSRGSRRTNKGEENISDFTSPASERSRAPMFLMWGIILVLIFFLFIIASTVFARVTIDIVPKQGRVILEGTEISAKRSAIEGELEFGSVSNEIIETATAEATGVKKVERKASGKIIVFNEFDENPQELIANTRFESPDGNIYRIQEPVTIPGMSGKNPGTIEVTVYADKAGDSYNIKQTEFTIPGFAGSARFDGFYAKSKTEISGGFIGEVKTVSEQDEEKVRSELKQKLEAKADSLTLDVPEEFVLFDGALITVIESVPINSSQTGTNSGEVQISEKLVARGILFNKEKLAAYLAKSNISDYSGERITISNVDELDFKLTNENGVNPETAGQVDFTLSGNAHLVWVVDTDTLKDSIRGLNKQDFPTIISRFPAIESIIPKFRPPWIRSIPDDVGKIKVQLSIAS